MNFENIVVAAEQLQYLKELCGNNVYFTCNGRLIDDTHIFHDTCHIRGNVRVLGGKGGFGSMLRALGARIEKTTNHEACRDLSGRRMRDVNNEKNIAEWLKKQDDKEEERQRKKQEKLEKVLNPTHHYEDQNYTSSLQKNVENIDDALSYARQKEEIGVKRKENNFQNGNSKKSKMWLGLDDDEDDISDEDENDEKIKNTSNVGVFETKNSEIHSDENENRKHEVLNVVVTKTNELESESEELNICKEKEEVLTSKETENNKVHALKSNLNATDNKMDTAIPATGSSSQEIKKTSNEAQMVDLSLYKSPEHLEELGLDRLKSALMFHGLKCGGTLQERAKRLFLLKDTPIEKLDANLFAKAAKKKKK